MTSRPAPKGAGRFDSGACVECLVCLTCGELFEQHDARQRYCSRKCRNNSPSKRAYGRERQRQIRERINAYKLARGCAVCGYNVHPAALQFDHIRGEKLFLISQDPKTAWSRILAEMDKCQVLCVNCHFIKTYELNEYHAKRKSAEQ